MQLNATNLVAAPWISLELGVDRETGLDLEDALVMAMDAGEGVEDAVIETVRTIVSPTTSCVVHRIVLPLLEQVPTPSAQPTAWSWIYLPRGGTTHSATSTNAALASSPTTASRGSSERPNDFAQFPSQMVIWTLDQEGKVPAAMGAVTSRMWI
ncbi:hypothetical protein BDV93DRAFT_525554 [Ceratobasidium sp. AG-I]|nr:hypothetical protein BDV93DRAFT_525554 [Ceratobasidium sp. AG-I]